MRQVMSERRRDRLMARIDALSPELPGRWGDMTPHEAICHLGDQVRCALGIIPTRSKRGPLRNPIVRWFVIYVMRWLRESTPAPPESLITTPKDFEIDRGTLRALVRELACQENVGPWPRHPYFGRLNGKMWADVTWKCFDHHLRQFGV